MLSVRWTSRRHSCARSNRSRSPNVSRQWIGLLCALPCVLSAPHCLLCRLLILRIATQPRRQGRPFLRLPASSLLPSAPGACLSLFHTHPPYRKSCRMSEKDQPGSVLMSNRLRLPRYRYRYVLVILSLIIYYFSNHPKPLLNRTQTEPAPRLSLSHSVTNRKGQNKP